MLFFTTPQLFAYLVDQSPTEKKPSILVTKYVKSWEMGQNKAEV